MQLITYFLNNKNNKQNGKKIENLLYSRI